MCKKLFSLRRGRAFRSEFPHPWCRRVEHVNSRDVLDVHDRDPTRCIAKQRPLGQLGEGHCGGGAHCIGVGISIVETCKFAFVVGDGPTHSRRQACRFCCDCQVAIRCVRFGSGLGLVIGDCFAIGSIAVMHVLVCMLMCVVRVVKL